MDCTYTCLENNIHAFVVHKATRQAVDEYLTSLKTICDDCNPDEPLRLLVDLSPDGLPPMRYVVSAGQKFYTRYTVAPVMRAAFLYQDGLILPIAESLMHLLRARTTRRAFHIEQRDKAIEWLLSGD